MSLFQCQHCGCCENTALSWQGFAEFIAKRCDWTGIEERKGLKLCSACAPAKFAGGTDTGMGKWHGRFARTFLPRGMFRTNNEGNLAHVESGDTDFTKYAVPEPEFAHALNAERYQWLRAQNWNDASLCVVVNPKQAVKLGHDCPSLERLDALVDAARSAHSENPPPGIYFSREADNFYSMADRRGQGNDFYRKWKPRCDAFPSEPDAGVAEVPRG
jgi:hypothetical protein